MPSRIDSLLNPSIGIADLLPMPDAAALPEARDLGTNLLQESGLENLFRTANSSRRTFTRFSKSFAKAKTRRFRRSFAKKSNRSCRTVFFSPPTAI